MKRYFPFLRGKLNELMALRELAEEIAESGKVIPLIEPVRSNPNTRISLDRFIQAAMPFLLICNPRHGDFDNRAGHQRLYDEIINEQLSEYDNWTPSLQLAADTNHGIVEQFLNRYDEREVAVVYQGLPTSQQTVELLSNEHIIHHVFVGNSARTAYIDSIDDESKIIITDRFRDQPRNADYPPREFFSDMNTTEGNPRGLDFGDFSIVGDQFSEGGGAAYAVAVHHVHYHQGATGSLDISHFISDRTETTADAAGKSIEAVTHLVESLNRLLPSDTDACGEYREMAESGEWRGLGYLKRLAIKHHLELMLDGGVF